MSTAPVIASGMRPLDRERNWAPISTSGAMTRFIGRRQSDASPVMKAVKGCPPHQVKGMPAPVLRLSGLEPMVLA